MMNKRKKATVKKIIKGLSKASKTHANQAKKLNTKKGNKPKVPQQKKLTFMELNLLQSLTVVSTQLCFY